MTKCFVIELVDAVVLNLKFGEEVPAYHMLHFQLFFCLHVPSYSKGCGGIMQTREADAWTLAPGAYALVSLQAHRPQAA